MADYENSFKTVFLEYKKYKKKMLQRIAPKYFEQKGIYGKQKI